MGMFVFGLLLLFVALVLLSVPTVLRQAALGRLLGIVAALLGVACLALSTATYVNDDRGGIIIRKFGPDLPANRVVASRGEKGPQAVLLGPGWHFGLWPWNYDVEQVPSITIEQGQVGVVVASDGKPLTGTEAFAEEWPSRDEMLDGGQFLGADKGFRGPQLTVLTPGRYRYNPRLFDVKAKPALVVNIGEVAVIKANAGPRYVPSADEKLTVINGTALVPRGFQGIWREALAPGAYNLHPDAYQVVKVQTTNRVYTYQDKKWAIKVRSKDGFSFPVDVRVTMAVSATDAPFLVALLATPDQIDKDEQEEESISVVEAKVILPLIRAIFRNVAEGMNALQFVNSRTQVESVATARMREELVKYRLTSEGVFIGNIDLDDTEAGKQLLSTQTDREVAVNQQQMFGEKKKAEESRATFIKAQEEAEQQRKLADATYQVLVREQQAKAREVEAQGEARYIEITFEARKKGYQELAQAIGAQGVTTLETLKLVADGKIQIAPQVMVTGGGTMDALAGTLLGRAIVPMVAAETTKDEPKRQ